MRVNMLIVLRIILVIGGRDKERVEVEHLDAESLQIAELALHADQIPAVEITHIKGRGHLIPVINMPHRKTNIEIFIVQHIVF